MSRAMPARLDSWRGSRRRAESESERLCHSVRIATPVRCPLQPKAARAWLSSSPLRYRNC